MAVTQRYTPPFAPDDIDDVVLDFSPAIVTGETITAATVTTNGGLAVDQNATAWGTVDGANVFTTDPYGACVLGRLSADAPGSWLVTFEVTLSSGRDLHRTLRVDVAPRS